MPIEYIGNELHNALVTHGVNCTCCDPEESTLHPNREMDERPAWITVAIGWVRHLTITRHGPTQYGDPRVSDLFGYPVGSGSD